MIPTYCVPNCPWNRSHPTVHESFTWRLRAALTRAFKINQNRIKIIYLMQFEPSKLVVPHRVMSTYRGIYPFIIASSDAGTEAHGRRLLRAPYIDELGV